MMSYSLRSSVKRPVDVLRRASVLLVGVGVLGEAPWEVLGQRRVADEQAVLLAAEAAVDPGQRLHQVGALASGGPCTWCGWAGRRSR